MQIVKGTKRLLLVVAIGNWMVGAIIFAITMYGFSNAGFNMWPIEMPVGLSMLTGAFVLQPGLLNKKPLYSLMMPMISVLTVWLTWPLLDWVVAHSEVKSPFNVYAALVPLGMSTAVVGAVVFGLVFLIDGFRTKPVVTNGDPGRRSQLR